MPKGKYLDWLTEDGLLNIEGWARDGLTNEQIAKNIGINQNTFYTWLKRYSEIKEALKKGRKPVDIEVENSLVKRALGFTEEEIVEEMTEDKDGNTIKHKKVTRKVFPPDTAAIIFYLKNRSSHRYKDRPKTEEEIESIRLDNQLKRYKVKEIELLLSDENPTIEKLQELINTIKEDAYGSNTDT